MHKSEYWCRYPWIFRFYVSRRNFSLIPGNLLTVDNAPNKQTTVSTTSASPSCVAGT